MGKKNIEKYSAGYALLKLVAGAWHNIFFYRKVIVIGLENISPDDHLIFAPNHQNALMDALAVLFTHKGQQVFLARADIFKKNLVASILYFLKILPVYRIRDGFGSLKGNDEIFTKTLDVLKNKNGLVILPEGDHAGFHRLRQLKKGICRVAFQSEEATGYSLNIKIIPVGLEYSHYTRFRQVLTVAYSNPIEVSVFFDLYRESPEKALNELRDKLATELKGTMVHIESEEDYEAINELRSIVNGKFSDDNKFPKLLRDRILITNLNRTKVTDKTTYEKTCLLTIDVKKRAEDLKIGYHLLEKRISVLWLIAGIAGLILTSPLFIYGSIFNLIFTGIPVTQSRKIKDPQFRSSVNYGISFALAIILTPVFLILLLLLVSPWWLGLFLFLTFPLTGLFAWNWSRFFFTIAEGFRIRNYRKNNNKELSLLRRNHKKLLNMVARLQDEK